MLPLVSAGAGLLSLVALLGAVTLSFSLQRYAGQAHAAGAGRQLQLTSVPTNIDVSQRSTNESEEAVAVNPTNKNNIVIVTNVDFPAAGLFEGVSFDGGKAWKTYLIGDNDNLGAACCDPSMSFDSYGKLFMTYLYNVGNVVRNDLGTGGPGDTDGIPNDNAQFWGANSTGNNPDGTLHQLDIYTASVVAPSP